MFDAVVVGVPDERWGERVVAVVQARAGTQPTLAELQEHARAHLAGYKVPRDLVVVDAIVRSPSGKPDYRWARATAGDVTRPSDRRVPSGTHEEQPLTNRLCGRDQPVPPPARATTPSTGTRGATTRSLLARDPTGRSSSRSGYSSCHWCHVMAHESFEDPTTAELMNGLFVNVKVDREERPDVDAVYMQAVQALTGRGGWPMSVWCTPDGRPFYGGTYYPNEDRHGMPSFARVCEAVAEAWRERRDEVLEQRGPAHRSDRRDRCCARTCSVDLSPRLLREAVRQRRRRSSSRTTAASARRRSSRRR